MNRSETHEILYPESKKFIRNISTTLKKMIVCFVGSLEASSLLASFHSVGSLLFRLLGEKGYVGLTGL